MRMIRNTVGYSSVRPSSGASLPSYTQYTNYTTVARVNEPTVLWSSSFRKTGIGKIGSYPPKFFGTIYNGSKVPVRTFAAHPNPFTANLGSSALPTNTVSSSDPYGPLFSSSSSSSSFSTVSTSTVSPSTVGRGSSSSIRSFATSTATTAPSPLSSDVSSRNPLAYIGTLIPSSLPASSSLRTLLLSISDTLFQSANTVNSNGTLDKRITLLQSYIPSLMKELQSSTLQSYKQSNPQDYLRILTVIIAAYSRGKGTGKKGYELLNFLYPMVVSLVPLMNYTELAVASEAYTHSDRKNILEHTLQANDVEDTSASSIPTDSSSSSSSVVASSSTFTQQQRTQQKQERSRLIASSLSTYPITGYDQERLFRAIHQRTLELLSTVPLQHELVQPSFYSSNPSFFIHTVLTTQTKKYKFTSEQIQELRLLQLFTSQDIMDALIRILGTISRTNLSCIDILDKVVPLIILYLQYLPLGERSTHCLVRIMGTYSRTIPSLGTLLDPLAERLNKEIKFAMNTIIEMEEDEVQYMKSKEKMKTNQRNKSKGSKASKTTISNVDGIRRRLQPLIGAVWHLAIATQFQLHTDTLLRGVRFINHACGIGIRISRNNNSFSSSSSGGKNNNKGTMTQNSNGSKSSSSSSSSTDTVNSVRSLRLNTSDIGRLAAIQLGIEAFRIQQSIRQDQAKEAMKVKEEDSSTENTVNPSSHEDIASSTSSPSSLFFPNLHTSLLPAIQGWHKLNQLRLQTSSLQLSVRRSIVELCNKTRLPTPSIEKPIEQGLIIDFGWKIYDPAGTSTSSSSMSENDEVPLHRYYPIGVAIEVDGPRHYVPDMDTSSPSTSTTTATLSNTDNLTLYSPSFLDGPTMYKYWLLESFGWQVIHVPYQEWTSLEGNSSSLPKQQYLLNRLRETPLKNSIRL